MLMDGHTLQSPTTTKAINTVLTLKAEKPGISLLTMKFSTQLMKRIMITRFTELNLMRAILIMTMYTLFSKRSLHPTSGSIFMTLMVKFVTYKPILQMTEQF